MRLSSSGLIVLLLALASSSRCGSDTRPGVNDLVENDLEGRSDGKTDSLADLASDAGLETDVSAADSTSDQVDRQDLLPDDTLLTDNNNGDVGAGDSTTMDVPPDLAGDAVEDMGDLAAEDTEPADLTGDKPDTSGVLSPDIDGPFEFTKIEETIKRDNREIPVVAYLPAGLENPAPLVVFLPGFQLTAPQYTGLMTRLASFGFVVVGATPPGSLFSVSHVAMAADAEYVIDWALSESTEIMAMVDSEKVGITGHSLGGKVSTMVAFSDSRVKALFAIDPVNGGSPIMGYTNDLPDIVPDQVSPLSIPLVFAGETTNSSGGLQPCAPAAQNFETFFEAATGSPWAIKATFIGADHMDFLDNPNCGLVCSACTAGSADHNIVKAALWTMEVAFFGLHLQGVAEWDVWLTGESVPMGVAAVSKP